jgi:predicted DsbA family dithiol-disulfide isomerase
MEGVMTQTTLAHRLLLKAWKIGGQATQQALLTVIFKSYFEDLANIGDTNVLADMAVTANLMTKEEVRRYQTSGYRQSDPCVHA